MGGCGVVAARQFCSEDDDGSSGLTSVNGGWYWDMATAASGLVGCLLVGIPDLSEINSLWCAAQ